MAIVIKKSTCLFYSLVYKFLALSLRDCSSLLPESCGTLTSRLLFKDFNDYLRCILFVTLLICLLEGLLPRS
jgi:hypothetical protein